MTEEIIMFNKSDVESIEEAIKRLEQERDELKFENDRYKQLLKGCPTEDEDCGLCVIDEQNKRLKQENRVLKDNNNHLQAIIDDGRAENKRFREENKELKELNKKICEDWGKGN